MKKLRLVFVLAVLVTVIIGLHWAARFDLSGPSGLGTRSIESWFDDPGLVVLTTLRWLALALAYYLLVVVAVVGLTADESGARRHRWLIPPGMAGLVGVLLGTTAVVVPLATHMVTEQPAEQTVAGDDRPLRLGVAEEPLRLTDASTADGSAERLGNSTITSSPDRPRPDSPPSVGADTEADTWPVETGDHLWSIARETLEDEWKRTDLTDREIAGYWRTVIAANEDRFVEPGNPDLILPGQRMVLPSVPDDPRTG